MSKPPMEKLLKQKTPQNNIFSSITKKPEKNPRILTKIDWYKYNWPICIKLIHFDLEEINSKIRYVFTILYINFFIWILLILTKFFVQIFLKKEILLIIFFLVFYFFSIFFQFFTFYSAYRGFFYDDRFKYFFKIFTILNFAFAILNGIVGRFFFDGIFMILEFFGKDDASDNVAMLFLLIFEFVLNFLFFCLSLSGFVSFLRIEKKYDN